MQYPLRSFYWCSKRMSRVAIRLSVLASAAITALYYAADTRNIFYVCYKVPTLTEKHMLIFNYFLTKPPLTRSESHTVAMCSRVSRLTQCA